MPFAIVQAKRLRLQAVTVGSRRDQIDMVRAIETHGIRPVVDSRFGLEDLPAAFARLKSGERFGKVCVEV
jgi:NADPH:quinone reductase-like Zn-dependent oxidoreductase